MKGATVEIVQSYRYTEVYLNNRLDLTENTERLLSKGSYYALLSAYCRQHSLLLWSATEEGHAKC